ncbi:hypothetical protein QFC20_001535 [Naganishia adeliensis]|uniref:Uncharacterized protein n=1 Tax=Naganishia adeliensis TaxID=92952 RepID=A0ACC2WV40_9TREE|nr:hypothetical protein QFC20_001535 [Naganishia adeliensis]
MSMISPYMPVVGTGLGMGLGVYAGYGGIASVRSLDMDMEPTRDLGPGAGTELVMAEVTPMPDTLAMAMGTRRQKGVGLFEAMCICIVVMYREM